MIHFRTNLIFVISFATIISCGQKKTNEESGNAGTANEAFVVFDSSFYKLVNNDAELEVLASGFDWSEGPVWVEEINALLFSDVPKNSVYKWSEKDSLTLYLKPSGYTGEVERPGEMGSNGLAISPEGHLVLCQHGDRRIAKMDAPLDEPYADFITVAGTYEGKHFNSPNDLCFSSEGNLYFTDPPYGLVEQMNDSSKELDFQGVFLVKPSDEVVLLVDSLTRPNGIILTTDEKNLIVANSDPQKPNWYIYDVMEDGTVENGRIYYSAAELSKEYRGLSDGLKADKEGNIFATGPGGVWVFNSQGKHLGIILTGRATSNCTLSPDEKTLYITADMDLMRIKMR